TRRRCAAGYAHADSGGDLRKPADRPLAQACEVAHVDAGRGRDLLDRGLDEVLRRMDVRRVEHAEDLLVDSVELHELLIARHPGAPLGLLAEIGLAPAAAAGDVRLRALDRLLRAFGAADP